MIDFDTLDRADIEVVNAKLTAQDRAEISKLLKEYKIREARKKTDRALTRAKRESKTR